MRIILILPLTILFAIKMYVDRHFYSQLTL